MQPERVRPCRRSCREHSSERDRGIPAWVHFEDLTGCPLTDGFDREKADLDARGLYLDMPAWGYHVFDVTEG